MTEILTVAQLGSPVLRQQAALVTDVHDPQLQVLIDALVATVQQENGVGIAAPQVGASLRLFIVASRPNLRYPQAPQMEPTAMINPRLLAHSDERVKDWEGCLCIPGIRGFVPRYQAVEVEYVNRSGQVQRRELTDFVARIFQHELDHLDGKVFLDRIESTHDIVTEQEYLKRVGTRSHALQDRNTQQGQP